MNETQTVIESLAQVTDAELRIRAHEMGISEVHTYSIPVLRNHVAAAIVADSHKAPGGPLAVTSETVVRHAGYDVSVAVEVESGSLEDRSTNGQTYRPTRIVVNFSRISGQWVGSDPMFQGPKVLKSDRLSHRTTTERVWDNLPREVAVWMDATAARIDRGELGA